MPALTLFQQCQTQWRVIIGVGVVQYQGLDYTAVESVVNLQKIDDFNFDDLRLIEAGALGVLNGNG